jgi:hypothetical protein
MFEKYWPRCLQGYDCSCWAGAEYHLAHATRLRGIISCRESCPRIGKLEEQPHADDLDFQIESDFIGIMSPGLPKKRLKSPTVWVIS